jgi:hypothetical protein
VIEYLLQQVKDLKARLDVLETIDDVPVVAVAFRNANQTIVSSATPSQLELNDEDIDTHSAFDTSTFTFTAPVGGYYHVDGGTRWANDADWNDGDLAQATVRVNGTNKFHLGVDFNFPASNPATQGRGRTVELAVGDTVDVTVRHLAGADVDIVGEAEGVSTWLSIHRVRGY